MIWMMYWRSSMIRVAILGYGNLGQGVEEIIQVRNDLELVGIFTRRDPDTVSSESQVYHVDSLIDMKDQIDVLILCIGSKSDIPVLATEYAKHFNTVDVYDNHNDIADHFDRMDEINRESKTTSIVATGWDPGIFSMVRLLSESILPVGDSYTFWGKGLSQGHSDAVRRVDGVKDGVQYTIPNPDMLSAIKDGQTIDYDIHSAHNRVVYIVPDDGADLNQIEEDIVTMPDYFADYDTVVHFIDQQTLDKEHQGMPHGGHVIRRGVTSRSGDDSLIELNLDLMSNPGFTAAVAVAYSIACYRLAREGHHKSYTVMDVPVGYLSMIEDEVIRKEYI